MELLELGRRVDAELVGEDRAGSFEGRRARRPADPARYSASISSPHSRSRSGCSRVRASSSRDGFARADPDRAPTPIALLGGLEPQLLEPGDLARRARVRPPGPRAPDPARGRAPRRASRRRLGLEGIGSPCVAQEPFEAKRVDLVGFDTEQVAGRSALDGARSEHGPEARDVRLQRPASGVGWFLSPQGVDQPLGGHDLVRVQDQVSEGGPLFRTAERECAALP